MKINQHLVLLGAILFFAFVVRLYHFTYPIADWHSWRQADTSAVSRNFVKQGFDVLHPRFDDLSNVPSGKDNPQGYRFVEFPLYNLFQAGFFSVVGFFTIEEWGRLVTITASLGTLVFLYLLLKKYASQEVGLLAVFFGAFLPYNMYYGRVVLPDPLMVTAILGGTYFFDTYLDAKKNKIFYFILALLFTLCAFLVKPYALFFTLPMLYLAYKKYGISLLKQWPLYIFVIVAVLPLVFWRVWMTQYPEGIPSNTWLLNGNGIRFRPAFFRWILYERITKLISGYVGILILATGTYALTTIKNKGFFLSFLLSSCLYIIIFATGNVQHDYYQILIMPTIAMFYGLGGYYLLRKFSLGASFRLGTMLLIILTFFTFYLGWKEVKGYYYINNPVIIEAGKIVEEKTPMNAKVIALYGGDTSFLYQTNRQGWASYQNPLPELIEKGATHLAQIDPTPGDITLFETEYEILASSSAFVVVKLQ